MSMWDKPLTRENIDELFHLFAAPAYRSTYRILGDTTRTENALTESFLEVYHLRNSDDAGDLVFLFSDILQKRVETLASRYPMPETAQITNRVLDEFTENSILSEIHHRIDSTPYRILEIFTASAGKSGVHTDPVIGQIQRSGISLFLVLQLFIAAIIIYAVTFVCATSVFGISDLAPSSPANAELPIEDLLVPVLGYLPLSITGQTQATGAAVTDSQASAAETTPVQTVISSETTLASASSDLTVASATRG